MLSFGTFAKSGQKLSAQTVSRLQHTSNSNTPQGGFNKAPGGFTPASVRGRDFAEDVSKPWSLAAIDGSTGKVTLTEGEIEIHKNTGTEYYAPSSKEVTLADGLNYIFAEIEPHAASPTVTLKIHDEKPQSDDTKYRPLIWRIDYNNTAKTITPVKPYRSQNIEFVGWRK
jgi:glucose/arabinose dehydrogenase